MAYTKDNETTSNKSKRGIDSKKKSQRNRNKKKQFVSKWIQCETCANWFSSQNGVYEIHLTQCNILQESLAFNIYQAAHNSKTSGKVPIVNDSEQPFINVKENSGYFTKRLSRIDLRRSLGMGIHTCHEVTILDDLHKSIDPNHVTMNEYQSFEHAWTQFEREVDRATHTNTFLRIMSIPFPSMSLTRNDLCALFGLTHEMPIDIKRARIRRLLIRW